MTRNALASGGWKSVCGASKREKKYEDGCTHLKVRSSSFHHGVNECVESVVDVRTVGHQQQKIIQIAGLIDANAVAPTNSMHESSCQIRHQSSGRECVCVCRERERERERERKVYVQPHASSNDATERVDLERPHSCGGG